MKNIQHYENLGYVIPRYKTKWYSWSIRHGTEIEVKVEHLTKKSAVLVIMRCEKCNEDRSQPYYSYRKYCKSCSASIVTKERKGEKHPYYKDGHTIIKKKCRTCGADGVRYNCSRCKECIRKAKEEKFRKVFCVDCGVEIKSKKAKRCRYCANNGVNNPAYNDNLTDEQRRDKQKHFLGLDIWRRKVFERDRFTCKKCGVVGELHNGKLHAHHIRNFDDFVEGRIDVGNGITFCEECHKKFHKEFGKKGNNVEQLNEFLNNDNSKKIE